MKSERSFIGLTDVLFFLIYSTVYASEYIDRYKLPVRKYFTGRVI